MRRRRRKGLTGTNFHVFENLCKQTACENLRFRRMSPKKMVLCPRNCPENYLSLARLVAEKLRKLCGTCVVKSIPNAKKDTKPSMQRFAKTAPKS